MTIPCPHCGTLLSLTEAQPPQIPEPPKPKFLLPVDYQSLPDSGPAWDAMLAAAKGTWPAPNLVNQDSRHGLYVLASAFVYARTGDAAMEQRARSGILDALPTFNPNTTNGALSLGRQLPAYILAADAIGLTAPGRATFEAFLRSVRDSTVGTHGRWNKLSFTFGDSSNNWGAHAGAAVIAIDRYLGNDTGPDRRILDGFLGNLSSATFPRPTITQPSWVAPNAGTWTPVQIAPNDPRDGAVTEDAWRAGAYPTLSNTYVMDSAQALGLQADLLGLDVWPWLLTSADFLKRNPSVWTTAGGRGGRGLAYLYNKRLGLGVPTTNLGDRMAWSLAWMDWIYG